MLSRSRSRWLTVINLSLCWCTVKQVRSETQTMLAVFICVTFESDLISNVCRLVIMLTAAQHREGPANMRSQGHVCVKLHDNFEYYDISHGNGSKMVVEVLVVVGNEMKSCQ